MLLYSKPIRRILRYALWGGVCLFVFLGLLESQIYTTILKSRMVVQKNTIIRPRFYSVDQKKQPYVIGARHAHQESEEEFSCAKPVAILRELSGDVYRLSAKKGFYDKGKERLDVNGNVILSNSKKYVVRTDQASMNLKTKNVQSTTKTYGNGPMGAFSSEGFALSKNGHVIELKGKSRLIITDQNGLAHGEKKREIPDEKRSTKRREP